MTYAVGDLVTLRTAPGTDPAMWLGKITNIHSVTKRPSYTVLVEATGRAYAGVRDVDLEPRT